MLTSYHRLKQAPVIPNPSKAHRIIGFLEVATHTLMDRHNLVISQKAHGVIG